jgi:hypothetical protein
MESRRSIVNKKSITNKGDHKSENTQTTNTTNTTHPQEFYDDADEQLAIAIQESVNDAHEHEKLMHLKLQEEADAEYARQLAAEFEGEEVNHANMNFNSDIANNGNDGDNMDDVLEEIARMEAQERLKATGHAYNGKTNISRVFADEDEEEVQIRAKVKKETELREWRAERARQDAAYAAAEEQDRLKANIAQHAIAHEPEPDSEPEPEPDSESELIPLSKEEMRQARIEFFAAKSVDKNL